MERPRRGRPQAPPSRPRWHASSWAASSSGRLEQSSTAAHTWPSDARVRAVPDSGPWLSSPPSPPLSPPLRHPNPALPPASSSADDLVCHGQDPWRRLTLRPRGTRPPPLALRLLLPGQRAGHLSCEVCASSGEFPIPQVRLQVYLVLLIQYWWILITLTELSTTMFQTGDNYISYPFYIVSYGRLYISYVLCNIYIVI